MAQSEVVKISEIYDLHTRVGNMGLIGVHTPRVELIARTYPGLCENHRLCKIESVDVALSAVSSLPVSPDQIGQDADDIAPEDMLNPILYKAVSNDAWSNIEMRINSLGNNGELLGAMIDSDMTPELSDSGHPVDHHKAYYGLLTSHDGFRKAHPQQGLTMQGLVPLVYSALYDHGVNGNAGYNATMGFAPPRATGFRGRPYPMPPFNCTQLTNVSDDDSGHSSNSVLENGMLDGQPYNVQTSMPYIPPVYLGAIVMPPARKTVMYYRMVVSASIRFIDPVPITEKSSFNGLVGYSTHVYHSDYATQSAKMSTRSGMVDTADLGGIEKVI